MGLFCPCVLFGRNVEQVRDNCTWIAPYICHAVFVEGGLALAAATIALHGFINPGTSGCIFEVLVFGWMMSGLCTSTVRDSLEERYLLERWPCDACLVHSYAHWCAICQEHRELKARLTDDTKIPMVMLNPPPVQEMNAGVDSVGTVSASLLTYASVQALKPDIIINAGTAGAFKQIHCGSICSYSWMLEG